MATYIPDYPNQSTDTAMVSSRFAVGSALAGVVTGAILVLVWERIKTAQNGNSNYEPLRGNPLEGQNSKPNGVAFSVGWDGAGFDESHTWTRGG